MKKIIIGFCVCFLMGNAHAWPFGKSMPKAKVTIHVVDETGQPVTNANIAVGFYQGGNAWVGETKSETIRGTSDSNGLFSAQGRCINDVSMFAEKEGCYRTSAERYFYNTKMKKGRWQPWNPTNTIVLKQIKNPIPMYVRGVNLGVPGFDEPLGFDLEKGDWVAPYGKGVISDFIFYATLDKRSSQDSDYRLTLIFPNEKDGIQTFGETTGSKFKSDHNAPLNGYLSEWKQFRKRRPKIGETNNIDQNRKFYFRIRTKLDEQGNIVSAQYGKIYGDFLQFAYYLNPTPNDRNVEFDPNKNLFGGRNRFAP